MKYNFIAALKESWKVFVFVLMIGIMMVWIDNSLSTLGYFFICIELLGFLCLTIYSYPHFSKTNDFIVNHEPKINEDHGFNNGIGYNYYYLNMTEPEIERILKSPVGASFSICYKYYYRLAASFFCGIMVYILLIAQHKLILLYNNV